MYQRKQAKLLWRRLRDEEYPFIQILVGSRQTGKTTAALQALNLLNTPSNYVSASDQRHPTTAWIYREWQAARESQKALEAPFTLVIDNIQLVSGWPEAVRALWDDDLRHDVPIKVVLVGLPQVAHDEGLKTLLSERYDLIRCPQWTFDECREAFGYTLDDFLYYGGYPGGSEHRSYPEDWFAYLRDSVIDPTINLDISDRGNFKPRLMRSLFRLGVAYSSEQIPYERMLHQLDFMGADQSISLSQYLRRFDDAALFRSLMLYQPYEYVPRVSLPQVMVYDTALMTAGSALRREQLLEDHLLRGRLIQSAVGAYLVSRSDELGFEVGWWREGNDSVDFVLSGGDDVVAVTVLSDSSKSENGLATFLHRYPGALRITVGTGVPGTCPLEELLLGNVLLPWG